MFPTYRCTIRTGTVGTVIEGDATPSDSQDDTARAVFGCDEVGRGIEVTIQPLSAEAQFILHAVHVVAVPSQCGPDDA
jgi:hypothetical protein